MPVTISKITFENKAKDLKTFDFTFDEPDDAKDFQFVCGQFAMISIDGVGEAPFGIASSPMEKNFIQFTIKRYPKGLLTTSLHNLSVGDKVGLRGPLGNGYPMEKMQGQNILIVGGGFALTTLRSVAQYVLSEANRDRYGKLTMLAAAREPGEMLYRNDMAEFEKALNTEIIQTIDRPAEDWRHKVGFAAPVLKEVAPSPKDAYALVCGPPIMIKTCTDVLLELDFDTDKILNSLEMKMACGIGKCGRCGVGNKYVCKDGPVFSYKELLQLTKGCGL